MATVKRWPVSHLSSRRNRASPRLAESNAVSADKMFNSRLCSQKLIKIWLVTQAPLIVTCNVVLSGSIQGCGACNVSRKKDVGKAQKINTTYRSPQRAGSFQDKAYVCKDGVYKFSLFTAVANTLITHNAVSVVQNYEHLKNLKILFDLIPELVRNSPNVPFSIERLVFQCRLIMHSDF